MICYPTSGEERDVKPKLIVEVLSPSTENIDRREKALNYRHVEALEEYVIASQRTPEITIFRRSENWEQTILTSPAAIAELRSVGLMIPLSRIYPRM